ncbi:Low-density receptor-like protein [Perilla frutescens var. frutescens]|nr:Low-density receptor-like protein [Perilla frutescens var. frutescens]
MASAVVPVSISGGNHVKTRGILLVNSGALAKTQLLTIRSKTRTNRNLSVRAQYDDRNGGSGADFVAGFLLGGAVFGTIAYIFAPQIRRSLLNEDEYGFRRAKKPIYYDEGLEKTRQTLNEKIGQLNSAIDNVSSRLRGGNNLPQVPVETDAEEATL